MLLLLRSPSHLAPPQALAQALALALAQALALAPPVTARNASFLLLMCACGMSLALRRQVPRLLPALLLQQRAPPPPLRPRSAIHTGTGWRSTT